MEMEGGAMGHHESMRTSWDGGISNQSFYGDMMGFYMLLYIYIFTIVYRFIYMGQHTTGWLVLVRCHVLPSFKGVNYQSIQVGNLALLFSSSMGLAEIPPKLWFMVNISM